MNARERGQNRGARKARNVKWGTDRNQPAIAIVLGLTMLLLFGLDFLVNESHARSLRTLQQLRFEDVAAVTVFDQLKAPRNEVLKLDPARDATAAHQLVDALNNTEFHQASRGDLGPRTPFMTILLNDGERIELLLHRNEACDTPLLIDVVRPSHGGTWFLGSARSIAGLNEWFSANGLTEMLGCG